MNKILITFLLLGSAKVFAESFLLRVEVQEQDPTGFYPPCKNKNGEEADCIHWSGWTIYKSRVIQVTDGNYEANTINVAVLQHANFVPEYVKDVYLIVKEFTNKDTIKKLGTQYYSDGPIGATEMVCLPISYIEKSKDNERFETVYWKSTDGKDYCYTKRGLDHHDGEGDL